jgi:hypothetical protein
MIDMIQKWYTHTRLHLGASLQFGALTRVADGVGSLALFCIHALQHKHGRIRAAKIRVSCDARRIPSKARTFAPTSEQPR